MPAIRFLAVTIGPVRNFILSFLIGDAAAHLERPEDAIMQELAEPLARHLLNDYSQHHIPGVAVGPSLAGRGVRCLLPLQQFKHLGILDLAKLLTPCLVVLVLWHEVLVILQPGSVVQDLPDRDLPAVLGKIRKDVGQTSFILQLPIVHEQHDRHCGELFGDRSQAKIRAPTNRATGSQVGYTIATLEDYVSILHNQQDRKSTRLNSSHVAISYAVFCLKKKTRGDPPSCPRAGYRGVAP